MNTKLITTVAGIAAFPLGALAQSGGPWAITASTTGGGGTSAGGPWSLTGTTGLSAAGDLLSGGAWAVTGGFWQPPVARVPDGPQMRMAPGELTGQPGTLQIMWGDEAVGYRLQFSHDLTRWTDTSTEPTGAGQVYYPLSRETRLFFRLRKLP
jgi:hypothetical protein